LLVRSEQEMGYERDVVFQGVGAGSQPVPLT
jgi:hypothetical protein